MEEYIAKFTAEELLRTTGGNIVNRIPFSGEYRIATDSRQDCSGAVFIAMKGEKFDPHDFLEQPVRQNAALLIIEERAVDKISPEWRIPVIAVADSLRAWWKLAQLHRRRFPDLKAAALTGSVGKTSVKEMTRAICAAAAGSDELVLATRGNTNNHFGVPANLLRLTPRHRYLVMEIGASGPGEIGPLAELVEPDAAAVNTIAACHLEKLGSLAGVAQEKAQIFTALNAHGRAVLPSVCESRDILELYAAPFAPLFFGGCSSDVKSRYLGGSISGSRIELSWRGGPKFTVDWQLSGAHQAANAACAAAIGTALGIAPETIAAGIAATRLPGMRMNVRRALDCDWVLDAYNANPESMQSALEWLAEFTDRDRFAAVLGDMLELGDYEQLGHYHTLVKLLRTFPESKAVLIGPRMKRAAALLPPDLQKNWQFFDAAADAAAATAELAAPGMTVLIKGSRGMSLEKALPEEVGCSMS